MEGVSESKIVQKEKKNILNKIFKKIKTMVSVYKKKLNLK